MRPSRTTPSSHGALTFGAALTLALAGVPAAAQQASEPQGAEAAEAPAAVEPAPEETRAAAAPPTSGDIEVITIRGRHHEDLLQDTAVSVTSFDTQELQDLRIQNIADLAEYTPNLDINTRSAASNPTLFIRGIGLKDYNANSAGAVAIYQDGININAPAIQLFQLFDVGSIEVLRGPQGSGSGRNATAGAIKINSNLPDGLFGATGSFSYGNYNTIEAEGSMNLPLIDELLSARFAFSASFADGNTENECADWDPESIGKPALTEATIRTAWEAAGRPTQPRRFPTAGSVDAQGRPLVPDEVCITQPPGRLDTRPFLLNPAVPPVWEPVNDPAVRTLEDFQGLDPWVNDVNNWAGRGLLRFQPLADVDWVLNAHGGQNRSGSRHLQSLRSRFLLSGNVLAEQRGGERWSPVTAAEVAGFEGVTTIDGFMADTATEGNPFVPGGQGGDDPFKGYYDSDGDERLDTYGVGLRGTWDLGSTVVSSLTGYEWYDRLVEDEGDASPDRFFPADYSDDAWQVSQELRVEGEGERYRWHLGGYFLQEKLAARNIFPGVFNFQIEQNFDQETWSVAPYAGARYELTEEVSLESGIRYNVEHKDFTLGSAAVGTQSNQTSQEIPEQQADKTWQGVTGDATLYYAPFWSLLDEIQNDNLNLYAKYSRGMKGGHFNGGLSIRNGVAEQTVAPVEPEFIHAVELGFKTGWFDDRLRLSGAVFRYWYKDLQVFDIINAVDELPTQQLLNSDASVLGAEIEFTARPLPGLSIQGGFGWLDSSFENFSVTKAVRRGPRGEGIPGTFDYSGNPLIAAPKFGFSSIVDYEIPLGSLGSLIPQYDFSWRSKTYFDPAAIDPISQDPYWLHNARLAYRTPDGRIEVAGWVQNFMDEQYRADAFDLSLGLSTILEVWGDPRTYGITVSYTW